MNEILNHQAPDVAVSFEWDGSKWVMSGAEHLVGDHGTCDDFGRGNGMSTSGDSSHVVIQGDQCICIFESQDKPLFPLDCFQVACSCLSSLGNM